MHIAFITPEFPHTKVAHAAGIGTSTKNLTQSLVKQGVKVTVFVYGQKVQEIIKEEGICIHLIKNKKYSFLGWYLHRKHIQQYCNSVIKKEKIDLLEAPDWTGITAFMKFPIPLLIRFHGSDTYFCHLEQRKQKWKNFFFEKLAVSKADAFIAPTIFAGELSKKLFGIKNKTILTIPHGLDLKQFNNATPEQFESGLLLYIGTLIRKKGVLELPGIFSEVRKQFPNARLLLIGSDAPDSKTQSHSTWKFLQNQFQLDDLKKLDYLGKIPYEEVQKYMKKAQVCLFPTFAESFGMVTVEAMAMQKAVVNSDIGWSKELIVDGESGYLVNPKNHAEFAQRIVDLLEDKELCLQIGTQARNRAEVQFDSNTIVKQNIECYRQLIKNNELYKSRP